MAKPTGPQPLTIRETIHHGDYFNVREQTVAPTWDGFVELLQASPYNAHANPADHASNRYAAKLFADLLTAGAGEHGWARYQVVANPEEYDTTPRDYAQRQIEQARRDRTGQRH